jgi:hypothetical protein
MCCYNQLLALSTKKHQRFKWNPRRELLSNEAKLVLYCQWNFQNGLSTDAIGN